MLHSLINTGINARLKEDVYLEYQEEKRQLAETWEESLSKELSTKLDIGIDPKVIPVPYNQKLYEHIVYDHRGCYDRNKENKVFDGEPLKSMALGGSIPAAMATLVEYFSVTHKTGKKISSREELLIEIGKILVENGYRTQDKGTLWLAFDKVLELEYGIRTQIQRSIFEVSNSICLCHPVVALVPTGWLHGKDLPSNECVIIWKIKEGVATISNTSSNELYEIDVMQLLRHAKIAWDCCSRICNY